VCPLGFFFLSLLARLDCIYIAAVEFLYAWVDDDAWDGIFECRDKIPRKELAEKKNS